VSFSNTYETIILNFAFNASSVSGNTGTNSNVIEFPAATGTWGTISYIAVFDSQASGTQIAYAGLSVSKTITAGDVLRIPAGDIDITLD